MKKVIAEFIGTFALVFIGCGTVVVGGMATGSTAITELAIALAFGLSIVAMAYGIGQISGCHVNPAVSSGSTLQEECHLRSCSPTVWLRSPARLPQHSCSI